MMPYAPPFAPRHMGQAAPAPAPAAPAPAPPAQPAVLEYTGVPGVFETLAVLTMSGAAAWVGARAAMKEHGLLKIAGYVGGIGSALLGFLYLGAKSGISQRLSIPQVRVIR